MAETTPYLYLGLAVVFSVLTIYIASLVVRLKNAHKDVSVLQELKNQ
jgi:hypothetical protein